MITRTIETPRSRRTRRLKLAAAAGSVALFGGAFTLAAARTTGIDAAGSAQRGATATTQTSRPAGTAPGSSFRDRTTTGGPSIDGRSPSSAGSASAAAPRMPVSRAPRTRTRAS